MDSYPTSGDGRTEPRRAAGARPDRGRGGRPRLGLLLIVSRSASSSSGCAVFRFIDHTRTIGLPGGQRVPRAVTTIVRYPASGGPYPLIVFAHGFAVTPATYAPLLRAWAQAGYVVAAPVFPLTNANAPGGPNESDLRDQPADVRLVSLSHGCLELAAQPRRGRIRGRIDQRRIAGRRTVRRRPHRARGRLRKPRPRPSDPSCGHPLRSRARWHGRFPSTRAAASGDAGHGRSDQLCPKTPRPCTDLAPRPEFLVMLQGASHLPPLHQRGAAAPPRRRDHDRVPRPLSQNDPARPPHRRESASRPLDTRRSTVKPQPRTAGSAGGVGEWLTRKGRSRTPSSPCSCRGSTAARSSF